MLSDKIRHYRKINNMSQDELAEKLDVSRQSISLWENGQTQPTIENIIALSKIFNVSANDLLQSDCEVESKDNNIPQKNKNLTPWIILGIVCAVIIVVLLCIIFFFGKDENAVTVNSDNVIEGSSSVESEAPMAFDLFTYCKDFAIQKGELRGDYTIYQQPSSLYGGYSNEYFSISYWGDSDMVEFCLHCPLDETFSINFYLRMRGGYDGKYEYLSSRYYRSDGENVRSASGYIDPSVFSESYPISCDSYIGSTDKQSSFMEESRVGVCDLIKCLKKFTEVENMECGFEAFEFANF